jgi:hypothetical protein
VEAARLAWASKPMGLAGVARQGTHGMALPDCFIDYEAPDATGGANDQHGHAGKDHDVSLPSSFAMPAYQF